MGADFDAMPSLFSQIAFRAAVEPHRPAVVLADRVVTYAMLAGVVEALTERLVNLALPRGALVGVKADNPVRHLAYCCWRWGRRA